MFVTGSVAATGTATGRLVRNLVYYDVESLILHTVNAESLEDSTVDVESNMETVIVDGRVTHTAVVEGRISDITLESVIGG
jgi:hypothetical protein